MKGVQSLRYDLCDIWGSILTIGMDNKKPSLALSFRVKGVGGKERKSEKWAAVAVLTMRIGQHGYTMGFKYIRCPHRGVL